MASEMTETYSMTITNGTYSDSFSRSFTSDQSGTAGGGAPGFMEIGTSEEVVSFGDVTPGKVILENLDDTNYFEYGPEDGGALKVMGKVPPGTTTPIWLASGVTLRVKANTAAVNAVIRGYNA